MLRTAFALVVFTTILAAQIAYAQSASTARPSVLDVTSMDPNVDPCTDFFTYSCGGWLKKNPIPPDKTSWGLSSKLADDNKVLLREILEGAASSAESKDPVKQKIGDYYTACMDEKTIEAAGIAPLQANLERINKMHSKRDLATVAASMPNRGVLFDFQSDQDFKNSTQVIAELDQGGLGLPDRDYYVKTDPKSVELRQAYVAHVQKMFEMLGDLPAAAATNALAVMRIETALANGSLTQVERRDPKLLYHKMTRKELEALSPTFRWKQYFSGTGQPGLRTLNVIAPEFFKAMNAVLQKEDLESWKAYLRWHLVHANAPYLSTAFVNADFDFFGKTLGGAQELEPRWKRCVSYTDNDLGEALGQAYVQRAFPPQAKQRAQEMVREIEQAMERDIEGLSWMSPETKQKALEKLHTVANKIGYPDKWRDYSTLSIDRSSYVGNRLRVNQFNERRDWNKIGKPVDRMEWFMSPPTVNAYYNPQINEIVFPAGILQPPFFDASADDALNYGGMGSVIGHEMTHGFDDQGRQFDATGNLANWWSDTDLKAFQQKAQCIVDQFNGFEVEKGLNENGSLVQGESIADLGGVVIAYAAFQHSMQGKPRPANIDGFTPEQRFFLGYARGWATSIRPELARLLVSSDPHPLAKFRVNGPLSNLPQFAAAFQCKDGDAMVRPEKDRCVIW